MEQRGKNRWVRTVGAVLALLVCCAACRPVDPGPEISSHTTPKESSSLSSEEGFDTTSESALSVSTESLTGSVSEPSTFDETTPPTKAPPETSAPPDTAAPATTPPTTTTKPPATSKPPATTPPTTPKPSATSKPPATTPPTTPKSSATTKPSATTPPTTPKPSATTKPPATTPSATTPASYMTQNVKQPSQPGTASQSNTYATVDYSYGAEGYISVKYNQNTDKRVKVRVAMGDQNMTYDLLARQKYEVFPLTYGSGTYKITVYEQVEGTSYAVALALEASVSLRSSLVPYVTPTQTVYFYAGSDAVTKVAAIAKNSVSDFEVVNKVYTWIADNISYDDNRAADVLAGRLTAYIPSPDGTLASKKGICYDYASLMAAMLRSYRIPTRLIKGYVSTGGKQAYHAWVEVYCTTGGTLTGGLAVSANGWTRIDATYAAADRQYHTRGYRYTTSSME